MYIEEKIQIYSNIFGGATNRSHTTIHDVFARAIASRLNRFFRRRTGKARCQRRPHLRGQAWLMASGAVSPVRDERSLVRERSNDTSRGRVCNRILTRFYTRKGGYTY